MNRYIILLLSCVLLAGQATLANAKKKKKTDASLLLKSDSTKNASYDKIVKDGVKKSGLFTVIYKAKDNKLYFEIPDSAFKKTYMLANRIASTSNNQDFAAGQMVRSPFLFTLTKNSHSVYMNLIETDNYVNPNDPIAVSFHRNYSNPILKGFKIEATTKSGNVVIDVTSFFGTNEAAISPLKVESPLMKMLGGSNNLKGSFESSGSAITEVKTFEKNIEIKSTLSFNLTGGGARPYTVGMHRSLFVLPDNPMPMRYQDNRVGYFSDTKNIFSSKRDKLDKKNYIERWRVEPKAEDMDRYFRGELVEPKKKIVFYVDSAFPPTWRQTIKEGVEVWNTAFEKAGFKNVVEARDYPRNDSTFDPDNMKYSCIKYVTTDIANAMGPSYTDPRTGEILCGDVVWYHNIVNLLHNWRFVQTAAVDKRVRKNVFDEDVMMESVKYAMSHEVGHTLGLMHNMGASYAFDVDSLRNPAFTQQYGTTPSIMDYARNNYVAQPGDMERGVSLLPPAIGVYDIYAINWGYRLIQGANTPDAEKPTLDKWIAEKANDRKYTFGAQQVFATIDPTAQTEDLGNDHIKAGNLAISNLKVILKNFDNWLMEPGMRYDDLELTYAEITKQYRRYLRHVSPYIGGIMYEEVRQGDGKPTAKHYVNKAQQKRAMNWLLAQLRSYDSWLTPKQLLLKMEQDFNFNDAIKATIITDMLNGATLYRIKEGGEYNPTANYTLQGYLNDVTNAIFIAPKGGRLSEAERALQGAAIERIIKNSGLVKESQASKSPLSVVAEQDEDSADLLPCYKMDKEDNNFARFNFGVSTLDKPEMAAAMMGRMEVILRKYRAYRASATGSTRDFYTYQIYAIESALSTNK